MSYANDGVVNRHNIVPSLEGNFFEGVETNRYSLNVDMHMRMNCIHSM